MDSKIFHLFSKRNQPRTHEKRGLQAAVDGRNSRDAPHGLNAHSLSRCSTAEARQLLSYDLAYKIEVLPLGILQMLGRTVLTVAIGGDPTQEQIASLRFATERELRFVMVDRAILSNAIFYAYHSDADRLLNRISTLQHASPDLPAKDSALPTLTNFYSPGGEAAQLLSAIIAYALSLGASDLHLLPGVKGCTIRVRVNGELLSRDEPICALTYHAQLVQRIKVLAKLDITEHALPQDGSFMAPMGEKNAPIRVGIMPTVHGEKVVLRFMGQGAIMKLSDLGILATSRSLIDEVTNRGEGMILFAGSTGSGKSTTMYSIMETLHQRNLSLVSVEDPVECEVEGVSQTSVNEKIGLTYPLCLKSVLRQDPDAILIGEIRDTESAQIAFQAALTGHLILSTVHARNVFEVLLRLRDLGVDTLTLAQGLSVIICQQLIPKLCSACKVFDLSASNLHGFTCYKKVGCKECDYSGFEGRVLVTEALKINERVSALLRREIFDADLIKKEVTEGEYYSPFESVAEYLKEGIIEPR